MRSFARLMRITGLLMIVGSVTYLWWMNQKVGTSPTQTEVPVENTQYRLISAKVEAKDCSIQIETSEAPINVKTKFKPGISKCEEFSIVLPSPSGQIVAFEDLSEGIDSWLKIYSAKHKSTIGVEVLGTSSILGMTFLPDDRLAVLHGYGLTGEQWLRVYDLPKLIAEYPENAENNAETVNQNTAGQNPESKISSFSEATVSQATSMLDLPPIKGNYQYIQLDGKELKLFGSEGVKSKPLAIFNIDSI